MPTVPIYYPRSLAAGAASGDVHIQARFTHAPSGVSLHPLQRAGVVAIDSHDLSPRMGASGPHGLGDPVVAAGHSDLTLPPLVPTIGGPRDPRFMV